jgi:hypothetical protein
MRACACPATAKIDHGDARLAAFFDLAGDVDRTLLADQSVPTTNEVRPVMSAISLVFIVSTRT